MQRVGVHVGVSAEKNPELAVPDPLALMESHCLPCADVVYANP